ncbi:MAG: hypothetical protein EAZ99_08185 [Alphaproteobacteria bacterium]|nr:MAG: hypothetical protein EAZ99_08185 [Alphaproteobacteria bacterium]
MSLALLLALAPVGVPLLLVLIARQSPARAAIGGLVATGIGAIIGDRLMPSTAVLAALEALLVWGLAASVILPGLVVAEAFQRTGSGAAVAGWIARWRLPTPIWALALCLAAGPAIEGATGFGVALIVLVPALLGRVPAPLAARLALVTLAIVPWGTMGLATSVASTLSGLPVAALAMTTALAAGPVFAAMGVLVAVRTGASLWLCLIGAVTGCALALALWLIGPRVGVAGAAVLAGGAVLLPVLPRLGPPAAVRSAWPLGLLVSLALAWTLLPIPLSWSLEAGAVRVSPLAAPGPVLVLVAAALLMRQPVTTLQDCLTAGLRRARLPLVTVAAAVLTGRLALATDLFQPLAEALALLPSSAVAPAAALIGLSTGWVTGSGVAGNALGLALVLEAGEAAAPILLAGVHNAATGVGAMTSVGLVALVASLAGLSAPETRALTAASVRLLALLAPIVMAWAWLIS